MRITNTHIWFGEHKYDRKLVEKIIALASDPTIENIVIDGFSGMGGVTEGFSRLPNWMVIACINHWPIAIATHELNHPDCLHLLEDFRTADLSILKYIIKEIKKRNPDVIVHCWFSLECTNFSNAKGGMSRDPDSRTLAEHTDRYIIILNPDKIWIENVKEFQLWGPMIPKVISVFEGRKQTIYAPKDADPATFFADLVDKGHVLYCPMVPDKVTKAPKPWLIPDPYRKGEDFDKWIAYTCSFGYDVEKRLMNCADQGVPQHRIRLIMQFTRTGEAITWPVKTHDKKGANGLPVWRPVGPCLDLEDEGESVLSFKMQKGKLVPRIKSNATIDRLINGSDKHVIGKREKSWIVKPFSAKNNTTQSSGASTKEPSPTVMASFGMQIAKAHMIDHYFGNGYTKPTTEPAGVSGTKDGISLHTMHFIDMQYTTGQVNKGIDETSGAILGNPKQQVVEVSRFIMDTQFNNAGHSLDETARTQTANRKHFYIVNFQWFNNCFKHISQPANTIIASMNKSPNYLIVLETGELAIQVFDHDPPHYVRMKKYMAENGIVAINMRMLKETELLQIMSMSKDIKLSKSSTANKKMIGNAVPPDLVEQLGAAYGIRGRQYMEA